MSNHKPAQSRRRLPTALKISNISAIYLFVLMFIAFSLWVPETFLTWGVWRSVLDTQSLTALAALAIVMPLAAGVINLAVGAEIGFASILVAALIQKMNLPPSTAVPLVVIVGGLVGVITGLLVVRGKIDSLIVTLGTSSILAAVTAWISNSQQIVGLGEGFQKLATTRVLGLTSSTWLMLVIAVALWYFLECTPAGRRVYATGGNRRAAEFAGVRTGSVIVLSFVVCGAIAALAGMLVSSRTGTGDPTTGPGYLLPAFAAAMLGSTQIKRGRYNVVGTLIAVYVLAVGIKGLQLAGAPVWIPDLFNGLALLIAVAVTARQRVKKSEPAGTEPPPTPKESLPEAPTVPSAGAAVSA